jgi:hypothetical protein
MWLSAVRASRADGGRLRIEDGLATWEVCSQSPFVRPVSGWGHTRRSDSLGWKGSCGLPFASGTVDATHPEVADYTAPWRSWEGHEVCGDSAWGTTEFQESQTGEGALLAPVVHAGRAGQSPRHPLPGWDHGHPVGRPRGKSRPDTCPSVHSHLGQYAAWNTW